MQSISSWTARADAANAATRGRRWNVGIRARCSSGVADVMGRQRLHSGVGESAELVGAEERSGSAEVVGAVEG